MPRARSPCVDPATDRLYKYRGNGVPGSLCLVFTPFTNVSNENGTFKANYENYFKLIEIILNLI